MTCLCVLGLEKLYWLGVYLRSYSCLNTCSQGLSFSNPKDVIGSWKTQPQVYSGDTKPFGTPGSMNGNLCFANKLPLSLETFLYPLYSEPHPKVRRKAGDYPTWSIRCSHGKACVLLSLRSCALCCFSVS